MCDKEDATQQASTQHLHAELSQIRLLHDSVQFEFELITARMGWLIMGQAFLFAAFATVIAGGSSANKTFASLITYLSIIIPTFGILLSLAVMAAVHAAHIAAIQMKLKRDERLVRLPEHLRVALISSRSPEHVLGNLPAQIIPWVIIFFWFGSIVLLPFVPWSR
jgi:hypothetical protein